MFGRTLGGMHAATLALPDLTTQARRLVELGLGRLAGLPDSAIHDAVASVEVDDALLVPGPALVTPSALAPLVNRADKPGFVVVDMTDLDQFGPIPGVDLPDTPFYLISGLDRGDEMANWSPDEALPAITGAGRTPLTVSEGIASFNEVFFLNKIRNRGLSRDLSGRRGWTWPHSPFGRRRSPWGGSCGPDGS